MEKSFRKIKLQINKLLKKIGDATTDYTIQVSENTANPGKITYSCMIHVSDRLEPLVWTCESFDELENKLEEATKDLNRDLVDIATYKGEIERCERLKGYYEDKIAEILGES